MFQTKHGTPKEWLLVGWRHQLCRIGLAIHNNFQAWKLHFFQPTLFVCIVLIFVNSWQTPPPSWCQLSPVRRCETDVAIFCTRGLYNNMDPNSRTRSQDRGSILVLMWVTAMHQSVTCERMAKGFQEAYLSKQLRIRNHITPYVCSVGPFGVGLFSILVWGLTHSALKYVSTCWISGLISLWTVMTFVLGLGHEGIPGVGLPSQ